MICTFTLHMGLILNCCMSCFELPMKSIIVNIYIKKKKLFTGSLARAIYICISFSVYCFLPLLKLFCWFITYYIYYWLFSDQSTLINVRPPNILLKNAQTLYRNRCLKQAHYLSDSIFPRDFSSLILSFARMIFNWIVLNVMKKNRL